MKKTILKIGNFRKKGFQSLTTGCLSGFFFFVKLFVMFFIRNTFFFPNHLRQNAIYRDKYVYVATWPFERSLHP